MEKTNTPKKRLALYKKALKAYEEAIHSLSKMKPPYSSGSLFHEIRYNYYTRKVYYGFCDYFCTEHLVDVYQPGAFKQNFPELWKHKPHKKIDHNSNWWQCGNFQSRANALKKAIVEIEGKETQGFLKHYILGAYK